MENYQPYQPPVQELTPADIEQMSAQLAEMDAAFEATQADRREQVGRDYAGVSPEAWDAMEPVFKDWYKQQGISEYNRRIHANRLDLMPL